MALDIKWIIPNQLLEVKETIIGWHDTQITYSQYDLVAKTKQVIGSRVYPMSDRDMKWVQKYYVPKANEKLSNVSSK